MACEGPGASVGRARGMVVRPGVAGAGSQRPRVSVQMCSGVAGVGWRRRWAAVLGHPARVTVHYVCSGVRAGMGAQCRGAGAVFVRPGISEAGSRRRRSSVRCMCSGV